MRSRMKTDIPYKHVTRETIENMMLHIVYVTSACVHEEAASLNDCLHVGPPFQNKQWTVPVHAYIRTYQHTYFIYVTNT